MSTYGIDGLTARETQRVIVYIYIMHLDLNFTVIVVDAVSHSHNGILSTYYA